MRRWRWVLCGYGRKLTKLRICDDSYSLALHLLYAQKIEKRSTVEFMKNVSMRKKTEYYSSASGCDSVSRQDDGPFLYEEERIPQAVHCACKNFNKTTLRLFIKVQVRETRRISMSF